MKRNHFPLFAAAEDPAGDAGGRGAAKPAAKPKPLPLDHEDLKKGETVMIHPKEGDAFRGFLDPVYGWMDERGVVLPPTVEPTGWSPL